MRYSATPTLSRAASHARSTELGFTSPTTRRLLGAVGGSASVGRLTRRRSTFGPPLAVVAVARTLLVPASRRAWNVASCQVSQLLVKVNASSSLTNVPLTVMSMGRLAVVPLA